MSIRNTKNPKEIPPELLELYAKNNPHDLLTKTVLSDLEIATFYLKTHIPKHLNGKLDWSKLRIEDVPMIDEKLDVVQPDILYRVPLIDRSEEFVFFYLLHEHQSTVDQNMPFRLLRYMTDAWTDFQKQYGHHRKLPIIIPIVFYTGIKEWNRPKFLNEVFESFFGSKQFIPDFNVVYIDLKNLDVELYRGMMVLFFMSLIMKLVHRDDFLEQLLEYSQEMSVLFEKHDVYFHQFMVYIISYRKGEGMRDVKKIVDTTVQPYQLDPESILAGVLREREQMIKDGFQEGIEQGIEEATMQICINLLQQGIDIDIIQKATNIPESKIQQIQKTLTTKKT